MSGMLIYLASITTYDTYMLHHAQRRERYQHAPHGCHKKRNLFRSGAIEAVQPYHWPFLKTKFAGFMSL